MSGSNWLAEQIQDLPGMKVWTMCHSQVQFPSYWREKDLNFGCLIMRTSFVYETCSPHHLRNIQELFTAQNQSSILITHCCHTLILQHKIISIHCIQPTIYVLFCFKIETKTGLMCTCHAKQWPTPPSSIWWVEDDWRKQGGKEPWHAHQSFKRWTTSRWVQLWW